MPTKQASARPWITATDYLLRAISVIAVAFCTWGAKQIVDVERRVSMIEANRITATDVLRELSTIRDGLAELSERLTAIPKETPPKWFVDRVDRIESKVEANGATLRVIVQRIGD